MEKLKLEDEDDDEYENDLPPTHYPGNGYFEVRALTCWRTLSRAVASPLELSASSMRSAISIISSSFIPRVVTAGVPTLIPPPFTTDSVSNGIEFLFTVIPARSNVSCACRPFKPLGRRSTSIK